MSRNLETDEDVDALEREYVTYFRKYFPGRKVDAIFDLAEFRVHARVASRFGEVRARLNAEFFGRTYRVHLDPAAKAFMHTSRVLHGAPANDFPSIEAALRQLQIDRGG